MGTRRHDNPFAAVLSGLLDQRSDESKVAPVPSEVRLDDSTCLVTGANSGLGKATAIRLAKRGAHVIMACRSGIPEAGEEVRAQSGNDKVEMMRVDLSDFDSIMSFCDELRDHKITLDAAVFNAGVVPVRSRKNKHGLELMFAVNFLAKFVLLHRLLHDGAIPNAVYGDNSRAENPPRVIFISSETHRSSIPIDFERFGEPVEYGLARIPVAGDNRGNLAAGAQGVGRTLSERDRWLCSRIGPELKARGMMFVGLDVIGDYLTEINVTSPTCIRELDAQYGADIAGQLMDTIARRLNRTR